MVAIVEVISAANAVELLSVVWMEVTMASLAAMVWFTVSGAIIAPKAPKKLENANSKAKEPGQKSPRVPVGGASEQSSPLQSATKALRQGRLQEAIELLQQLPETLAGYVPASVAPRLLMAVAKAPNFDEAIAQLKVLMGKIEGRALEAVILEAVKNKDMAACRQLQVVSSSMSIPKTTRTLEALARAHASDLTALRILVEETDAPLAKGFAGAVLEACAAMREVDLVLDVFDKVSEADAAALRIVAENASKASKASKGVGKKRSKADSSSDASNSDGSVETCSSKESLSVAKEIRACGKNGNLKGAFKIFEQQGGQNASTSLYNAILDVCAECPGGLEKALRIFSQAENNGTADIVSYNTMMKVYLAQGDEPSATRLLGKLSEKGLVASPASYHGLLNARVNARDRSGAWKMLEQMQAAGVSPNQITCSILLKAKLNSAAEVAKVLGLMDTMGTPMDEVCFASVVEACVRTNCLDLLSKHTAKFAREGGSLTLTAATYGSMIKAYGQVQDVKRVWELWTEMTSKNVQPTAITLGCMTEALVSNACVADAWKLAQQLWSEESTKALVNTVIYSTILKGFAKAREIEKVMALYQEMRSHGVQPNTITYNTILNAFAQNGAMDRVPALLEDMKSASPPVEPDVVTYSTIVKGFCNSGSLDRALDILRELQTGDKFKPDEVMYNSLLDGCAREHRPDDALKLLADMKKFGVPPSNYTLSMLVKLMGRCRRINQAFTLINEVSQEYGLKVNIQVYTCLIQACFSNRQASKAVALYDQIMKEGLVPDEYTYTVLVKGCLQAGLGDKAKQLQAELDKCKVAAPRRPQGKGASRGRY